MLDWGAVITSAAVGATVSAVATVFGQWRARVSDRRRVVFERSLEMARLRTEISLRIVEHRGGNIYLVDPIHDARRYHTYLSELYDSGQITRGKPIPPLPIWPQGEEMPDEILEGYEDAKPAR
ncbi:MAG TPA: hypothetical protein VHE30_25995 [Polyangiaceae bacterium]|nr:hypothetical protein [Polyangiaceae bacterium]